MDIDLLWAIWGWFLIPDCMAMLKSSISETSSKSQNPFLLFLGLIFIFLVLVHSSDPSNPSTVSKLSTQTLVPRSSPSASSAPSSSTMNLHPRKRKTSHTSTSSREFKAGEHEVPSGPNPISN